MPRNQPIFVIHRRGKWYAGKGGWTDDLSLAAVAPRRVAIRMVRLDIGMPCEIMEVAPSRIEGADLEPVSMTTPN